MRCPSCGADGPCYCSRSQSPARPRNTGYPAPVYRTAPRSHAHSCRCRRCSQVRGVRSDPMAGGLMFFVIPFVIMVAGFWPAMVWHGEGGPTGTAWRWDIHSTIAELVYFGIAGFVVFLCWLGNRQAKPSRPPKGRLQVEATQGNDQHPLRRP